MVLCRNLTLYQTNVLFWNIQALICAAVCSIFVLVPFFNTLFRGSGYWAIQSSLLVLEDTTGASVKKSFERILGTIVGGLLSYCLFALVTGNEKSVHASHVKPLLILYILLWPLPWGYIRYRYPNNVLIGSYGTFTGYLVVLVSYLGQGAFRTTMLRIAAVTIGVTVTCIVTQFVFPNSARRKLNANIANTLESMAEILNPLLECSTGLQYSKQSQIIVLHKSVLEHIRTRDKKRQLMMESLNQSHHHHTPLLNLPLQDEMTCQIFAKIIDKSKSTAASDLASGDMSHSTIIQKIYVVDRPPNSIDGTRSRLNSRVSIDFQLNNTQSNNSFNFCQDNLNSDEDFLKIMSTMINEYNNSFSDTTKEYYDHFKLAVKAVNNCRTLADTNNTLFLAARQEIFCRREPTIFPEKKYKILLHGVDSLFNHIASLLFSLHIQIQKIYEFRIESISALKNIHVSEDDKYKSKISRRKFSDTYFIDSLEDNVNFHKKIHPNSAEKLFASIMAAFIYTDVFGNILQQIVNNIHSVLILLAKYIRNLSEDYSLKIYDLVKNISVDIDMLIEIHQKRQKIYSNIFEVSANNFSRQGSRRKESDFGLASTAEVYTALPWEELMGIDAKTFQQMSKSEHEVYWKCFWFVRDKLSITTGTLLLLNDQIIIIYDIIEQIKNS